MSEKRPHRGEVWSASKVAINQGFSSPAFADIVASVLVHDSVPGGRAILLEDEVVLLEDEARWCIKHPSPAGSGRCQLLALADGVDRVTDGAKAFPREQTHRGSSDQRSRLSDHISPRNSLALLEKGGTVRAIQRHDERANWAFR